MRHVAQFRSSAAPNAATSYASPTEPYAWETTEARGTIPWCVDGTFSRLYIQLDSAPGVGKSLTFTLLKNGVATALTVTISDTATEGSDTSNSVSVVDGDDLTLRCTPTNTPTLSVVSGAIVFDSTNRGESGYGAQVSTGGNLANTAASNGFPFATTSSFGTFALHVVQTVPGEYTKYTIMLDAAPGVGSSRSFVLEKNGVAQDGTSGRPNTAITISGTSTEGSATFVLPVEAGDYLSISITGATGSPASARGTIGARFRAYRDGESMVPLSNGTVSAPPATEYGHGFGFTSFGSAPSAPTKVWDGWTLLRMSMSAANALIPTGIWTFRKNGVNTSIINPTTGSNIRQLGPPSSGVSLASGDTALVEVVTTSGSTRTVVCWGAQYIAPTADPLTTGGMAYARDGFPVVVPTTGLGGIEGWLDGMAVAVADLVVAGLSVAVSDSVSVGEEVATSPIYRAVSDAVTVTEQASTAMSVADLSVSVFEDVVVTETFSEQPDANVRDTVTVAEVVTTALTVALIQQARYELVAVLDVVTARLSRLADVNDAVTVAEALTTQAWETLRVESADAVGVVENTSAVLNDAATAAPNETVAVTEDVASLVQETLSADVFEAATAAEGVTARLTPLQVSVFEAVGVSDLNSMPIAAPGLFDRIVVTDAVTVVSPLLVVAVAEAVAVSEGGLNPNVSPDGSSYGPTPTTLPGNALEDYWVVGLP